MKFLFYLLFFCLCSTLYVRYLESKTVFIPTKGLSISPTQVGLEFENVYYLTQDDIKLHGWYVPAKNARATLIFCHGNAGNIGDRLAKLAFFL